MKLDVHITTCNRTNVKCRPRPHENSSWNVKEWTHQERIEISKLSIESILKFCCQIKFFGHSVSITVLDDGSDIKEWLDYLDVLENDITVKRFPPRGSSAGINEHINNLVSSPPDYIFHVEDDNLLFNPLSLDVLGICNMLQNRDPRIKVITFRSGLPVESSDKGYHGDFGPIGSETLSHINCIYFKRMGNAHHLIRWKDYLNFMPLDGNTGGCEASMNNKLLKLGFNIEPQIHVHAFHSHMFSYPITTNNLNSWHKTGEGFEFGHKEMNEYLKSKNKVISKVYKKFPDLVDIKELTNYAY